MLFLFFIVGPDTWLPLFLTSSEVLQIVGFSVLDILDRDRVEFFDKLEVSNV